MDTTKTGADSAAPPAAAETIGVATMEADGTIVLQLRAQGPGMIGDAMFKYPPSHPQYAAVLAHLDGLATGETKAVRPWS